MTRSVQSIIDLWPSLADFAADAGVTYGAAKQMRRRGSIPLKYWAALLKGAEPRAFNLDQTELMAAHSADCSSDVPRPASHTVEAAE